MEGISVSFLKDLFFQDDPSIKFGPGVSAESFCPVRKSIHEKKKNDSTATVTKVAKVMTQGAEGQGLQSISSKSVGSSSQSQSGQVCIQNVAEIKQHKYKGKQNKQLKECVQVKLVDIKTILDGNNLSLSNNGSYSLRSRSAKFQSDCETDLASFDPNSPKKRKRHDAVLENNQLLQEVPNNLIAESTSKIDKIIPSKSKGRPRVNVPNHSDQLTSASGHQDGGKSKKYTRKLSKDKTFSSHDNDKLVLALSKKNTSGSKCKPGNENESKIGVSGKVGLVSKSKSNNCLRKRTRLTPVNFKEYVDADSDEDLQLKNEKKKKKVGLTKSKIKLQSSALLDEQQVDNRSALDKGKKIELSSKQIKENNEFAKPSVGQVKAKKKQKAEIDGKKNSERVNGKQKNTPDEELKITAKVGTRKYILQKNKIVESLLTKGLKSADMAAGDEEMFKTFPQKTRTIHSFLGQSGFSDDSILDTDTSKGSDAAVTPVHMRYLSQKGNSVPTPTSLTWVESPTSADRTPEIKIQKNRAQLMYDNIKRRPANKMKNGSEHQKDIVDKLIKPMSKTLMKLPSLPNPVADQNDSETTDDYFEESD